MRRRQFVTTCSGVLLGSSALRVLTASVRWQPADIEEGPWDALLADLDRQIVALMDKAGVPGLSIAIVRDGQLLWRRAFGVSNVAVRRPVDNDTLFEAASMSKPLFAYVVMKLCERGVLNLDTPLTTYTTERFLVGDPRLDRITAREVLSHTTGFPNWRSKEHPLAIHFTPGARWSYSGEGYSYLQSVVTHLIGGRTNPNECGRFEDNVLVCATVPNINDYMQSHLLVPLGMRSSGYLWADTMEARMAHGYDPDGKPLAMNRKPNGPSLARYGMAGGLCTTPTDYAKFLTAVIDPQPSDQFRLTARSLQEMLRPQVRRNAVSSWALGWEINHTENGDFIRHGGGNPGFACFAAGSLARKSGYVIMTNRENVGYTDVVAPLITGDTLARFIGGKLRGASE